jgi:hypothetical protein
MNNRPQLSAGLVAVKGNAAPAVDMPPRTSAAPPQAVASKHREERAGHVPLKPLNFRIPADFRRAFKTYAARHDLKLNELLFRCFDAYRAQQGD